MTWVRVEEDAPLHPKFMQVGVAGFGFFVASLCYANHYLTDGLIPASALPAIFPSAPRRQQLALAEALVTAGLWERVEGGWRIHDFHDYQPTKDAVIRSRDERYAARVAGGQARAAKALRVGGRFTSRPPADGQQATSYLAGDLLVTAHQQNTSPVPVPDPVPEKTESPNGLLSGVAARPRPSPLRQAAIEVLEWLNARAGRSFRPFEAGGKPSANLLLIEARLKSGITVPQLKAVVSRKVRAWAEDPERAVYLRPETLFGKRKCEQYVGELPRLEEASDGDVS